MTRRVLGLLAGSAAAFALTASAASAAAPTATTGGAGAVSATSARLHGTVVPDGKATSWYFQVGATTSYGTDTATKNAGSGTKPVDVAIDVKGLAAGTTYDYRLVASNSNGTTFGANQSFATQAPPGVQTQAAQSVGVNSATAIAAADPHGLATTWWFEYGTTTSYGAKTQAETLAAGAAATTVSAPIGSLTPGTTYHYRLDAKNSAGTIEGADVGFTTLPALTLKAHALSVVHGNALALSGIVTGGPVGASVTILAERYGATSFTQVGTTLTRTAGGYVFYVHPAIQTTYMASANGGNSQTAVVGVRPAVTLTTLPGARLQTHVSAGVQLIGRQVQLQRLASGRWVTVGHDRLNTHSTAVFSVSALPHGRSTIRIALSVNESGPGLLAGFSRTLTYHRR